MKKSELIKELSGASGETQGTVKRVLDGLDAVLMSNARNGEETTIGLLTVATVRKAARPARNPRTGAEVVIPARQVIKVKVGKALKDAANWVSK